MKKISIIAIVSSILLCGCKSESKTYGNIRDYSLDDTEDYYIVYAFGEDGCYSDGSFESNMMFDKWVENYNARH